MFGLLNPALTPIKAKIALVVAGAILVTLLVAGGVCLYLSKKVDGLQIDLGAAQVSLATAVQTSNDNAKAWDVQRTNLEQQVTTQKALAALADKVAIEARAREAKYDRALKIALNTLKETTNADPEAAEWSVVRLPDAVVDGMCRAAAAAAGEAAECRGDENGSDHDSGAPPRAVQDRPTT